MENLMKARQYLLAALLAVSIIAVPAHTTATPGAGIYTSTVAKPGITSDTTTAVQKTLRKHGYSVIVDGIYGRQTTAAVRHWQRANGLLEDGIAGPVTLASLGITGGADATSGAARVSPPGPTGLNGMPFAPDDWTGCLEMEFYRQQAGLPSNFSDQPRTGSRSHQGFGWRESNCRNDVVSSTGCCFGYWQNYISSHLSRGSAYRERIINECQVSGVSDIYGNNDLQKQKQACVTAIVYSISGLSPWNL
jgi:hypothetical protein